MESLQNLRFDRFGKHHNRIPLRRIYWFVFVQFRRSIANIHQISNTSMPCSHISPWRDIAYHIFFSLYVSVYYKYHQVLFHAVRNFIWNFRFSSFLSNNFCRDVFVTKTWILYCKAVTYLFSSIKEHVLGNNVVTKYIF